MTNTERRTKIEQVAPALGWYSTYAYTNSIPMSEMYIAYYKLDKNQSVTMCNEYGITADGEKALRNWLEERHDVRVFFKRKRENSERKQYYEVYYWEPREMLAHDGCTADNYADALLEAVHQVVKGEK